MALVDDFAGYGMQIMAPAPPPKVVNASVLELNSAYDFNHELIIQWFRERGRAEIHSETWEVLGKPDFTLVREQLTAIDGSPPAIHHTHHEKVLLVGRSYILVMWVNRLEEWTVQAMFVPWAGSGLAHVPAFLRALPTPEPASYVQWFYMGEHGITSHHMPLAGKGPRQEFYPGLPDIQNLFREYAESDAGVLLLLGAPGTGKTTFLRGMLRSMRMQAWLTYDQRVQAEEQLYIQFAQPSGNSSRGPAPEDGRVLVLEDAENILSARKDGNMMMSRLLNLSNGLVSLPKRKLVFSTNLPSLSSVDEALLRPGRCFGVIQFRPLTACEATAARAAAGLPAVEFKAESYTLAEALNDKQAGSGTGSVRRVGFS